MIAKAVIDLRTLKVWKSAVECAKELGCAQSTVRNCINKNVRCKSRRLKWFEDWMHLSDDKKEEHTRQDNIFFLNGKPSEEL